jgi:hypothetical protein
MSRTETENFTTHNSDALKCVACGFVCAHVTLTQMASHGNLSFLSYGSDNMADKYHSSDLWHKTASLYVDVPWATLWEGKPPAVHWRTSHSYVAQSPSLTRSCESLDNLYCVPFNSSPQACICCKGKETGERWRYDITSLDTNPRIAETQSTSTWRHTYSGRLSSSKFFFFWT